MKYLRLLTALIVYTTHRSSAQTSIIGSPSTGNSILYSEELTFTGGISIESNIPVTLQQYTYDASPSTDHPLNAGAAVVQVSSSCSTDESDTLPIVTASQGARGLELTVRVLDADPNAGFLESSSYQTSWTEFDCPPLPTFPPDPEVTRPPVQAGGFCLTQEDCDAARVELGFDTLRCVINAMQYTHQPCSSSLDMIGRVGAFPTKGKRVYHSIAKLPIISLRLRCSGCFSKKETAYFSTGTGVTEADMSTTDLPTQQKRIFCDGGDVSQSGRTPCSLGANSEPCGRGEVCDISDPDACTGFCRPATDTACIEIYQPVCGCGGVDYSNRCKAETDGNVVKSEGRCDFSDEKPTTTGASVPCLTANECDERRQELGLASFQVGQFPTSGCFR